MRTQSHISEWDVAEVEMHTRADKAAAQLAELSRHIDMIARLVVAMVVLQLFFEMHAFAAMSNDPCAVRFLNKTTTALWT
jgi:hypothetical protein